MKRKAVSVLVVLSLICSLFAVNVSAAMGDYGGNITGATWYWPIHGYSSTSSAYSKITSSYGYRGGSIQGYHKGVDIGENRGTAVYATRGGTVYLVDNSTDGSEGRSVIINHNDGYYSAYYHLSSISVSSGQSVNNNTQIGAVGGSGYNSESYYANHLHFAIHYGTSWNYTCSVNPCPSGYTRIGDSFQESAGGYPIGSASISYSLATATPVNPPSNCWVNINKGAESTYTVNETVNFTYHAENVNYYIFEIYKDGASYECTETYYGQCSRTFTRPGRYNSVVTAVGDGGRTSSGWISWNVVDPSAVGPNVPYVSVSNRNIFPQEQFRINFWAETAKYYNVKVTKNGVTYKDQQLYVGYYDTSLSEPGNYSIQVTAVNDYGSSSAYDGVQVIGTVPGTPQITTAYDCYGINEDVEIMLTAGKYTQTSYMTIRKCTDVWETVFSGSVTDLTTKTYRFTTAGYYQIEYQNSNIYGASPCAAKAICIYDSAPDQPIILMNKSAYEISESITVTLLPSINVRSAYMSVYNSYDEVVFSQDVSGQNTQVLSFDTAGQYTINYQTANTLGQSKIAVSSFSVGKENIVVSFDANGGVLEQIEKTVFHNSPYGELPVPQYVGMRFVGWYTKATNGKLITEETIVSALDDHTLYAVWKILPSTETSIIKKSAYSLINTTVKNADNGDLILIAVYKDGKLTDLQTETYGGEDISIATLSPYDTVKVMIWNDLTSSMPLCPPEIITQ